MGRKRRSVERGERKPKNAQYVENPREDIEQRLGHTKQVCQNCNARNPERADACRKCGSDNLRPKSADFRD